MDLYESAMRIRWGAHPLLSVGDWLVEPVSMEGARKSSVASFVTALSQRVYDLDHARCMMGWSEVRLHQSPQHAAVYQLMRTSEYQQVRGTAVALLEIPSRSLTVSLGTALLVQYESRVDDCLTVFTMGIQGGRISLEYGELLLESGDAILTEDGVPLIRESELESGIMRAELGGDLLMQAGEVMERE